MNFQHRSTSFNIFQQNYANSPQHPISSNDIQCDVLKSDRTHGTNKIGIASRASPTKERLKILRASWRT